MTAPMITTTELSLIRTTGNAATMRVRMRRTHRGMIDERLNASRLWRQAIDPTCNRELALMMLDRCVDCLRRAKHLEQVLESPSATKVVDRESTPNRAIGLSGGY